ncbi:hypothetical protein F5J12DRAFT_462148 [Pisolithus orientalis]|uniref:uncharacterized protein n=1 Tax=Pisolithus orientalis TaxID=936130 RepID=UPI0022247B9F|nr:uncharacterized protein F5J12DRAFT_462148 [Pisolithus orientalis]KAI5992019.1 hypothetical protein F5J12DRAFT_462148 [Pisolithus orientalis]
MCPIFYSFSVLQVAYTEWLGDGRTLLNAFGPSQSICGFTVEIPVRSSASNETPATFNIGGKTRLYVLDCDIKFVAVGCVGKIFVSSPTVGLGYVEDPEDTTQLFMVDPFRKKSRMYRTGDFGQ